MSLRRISWLVACLVIPFAVGCGQESGVVKEEEPVSVTPGDVPDPRPLMGELVIDDIGMALDHWGDDVYELHTVGEGAPVVEDDALTLTVSYGGGCARHDFTLVADGEFRESNPVQLDVFLAHDANDDRCQAYPTEAYEFDLTPIQVLYRETYGTDAGAVLLHFYGQDVPHDDPVLFYSLIYTFD